MTDGAPDEGEGTPIHPGDLLDASGQPRALAVPVAASNLLDAAQLLLARATFRPCLTFADPALDALVVRSGPLFEEVARAWEVHPLLNASSLALLPLAKLVDDSATEEDVHAIARVLCSVWPEQQPWKWSPDQAGHGPTPNFAIPGRAHMRLVDPGNAPHVACAVYRRVAMVLGVPELDTASLDVLYISEGHDDEHVQCRIVRSEFEHDDAGYRRQSSLDCFPVRRADLAEFARELRSLERGQSLAWLQSAHRFDPVLYDGSNVSVGLVGSDVQTLATRGFTLDMRRTDDDPTLVEGTWSHHFGSSGSGSGFVDDEILVAELAAQVEAVVAAFPPPPGAASSPRPRSPESIPEGSDPPPPSHRVFPSYEGVFGDDQPEDEPPIAEAEFDSDLESSTEVDTRATLDFDGAVDQLRAWAGRPVTVYATGPESELALMQLTVEGILGSPKALEQPSDADAYGVSIGEEREGIDNYPHPSYLTISRSAHVTSRLQRIRQTIPADGIDRSIDLLAFELQGGFSVQVNLAEEDA